LNKGDIKLVKAQPNFLKGCLHLIQELAEYEKAPNEVVLTLEVFEQDFLAQKFDAWLAIAENTVVGMALFYPIYSTWKGASLHLEDLIVQKNYRQNGIGHLLFEKVIETAKQLEVGRLQWQVLDWNNPAISFYNKYPVSYESVWLTVKISKETLAKL